MTTKTKTPEALREEAERLHAQAAEAQAAVDAETMREWEAEQADLTRRAQETVDSFDAAALDQDVDDARQRLDQAVSDMPVTQALAGYLAAQYARNWAHADLAGARGRLGLPTGGGRPSGTTELRSIDELIIPTAQRDAQRLTDTYRQEQAR